MPGLDGYEVCRRLKADKHLCEVPVIFITTRSEASDEEQGLILGAADYIGKPFIPSIVRIRVKNHVELRRIRNQLKMQNLLLEDKVRERTLELNQVKDITIHSLAVLAETRDNETCAHILRTKYYVKILAECFVKKKANNLNLTSEEIELIFKSAPLHDIGKVGVPDHILHKPERLTPEEFEIIKLHTVFGLRALIKAEQDLKFNLDDSFLRYAREIIYTHHERWDGSGYPEGLVGESIPLSGRIMALADVYDALISKRIYKSAFTHEEACDIIFKGRGSQFDPIVVDAFDELKGEFRKIADEYVDIDDLPGNFGPLNS